MRRRPKPAAVRPVPRAAPRPPDRLKCSACGADRKTTATCEDHQEGADIEVHLPNGDHVTVQWRTPQDESAGCSIDVFVTSDTRAYALTTDQTTMSGNSDSAVFSEDMS